MVPQYRLVTYTGYAKDDEVQLLDEPTFKRDMAHVENCRTCAGSIIHDPADVFVRLSDHVVHTVRLKVDHSADLARLKAEHEKEVRSAFEAGADFVQAVVESYKRDGVVPGPIEADRIDDARIVWQQSRRSAIEKEG